MNSRVFASLTLLLFAAMCRGATPDPENRAELASLAKSVEAELRGNILPFWLEHARDRERGGFFGEITKDLRIKEAEPRGALLTSRILWTFSAAYRRYQDPAYLEMARWAYDDLLARFWDKEHGGLFWKISASGEPLDPRKIAYVQAFGIYGLSEYHRATGDPAVLDRAIELYRSLERHGHDRVSHGYFEEFSRDWKISRARGDAKAGSAMKSLGQKSQNAHIHILEAFTNLLRVWPDQELRQNLREVTDVLLTRILDSSNHHLRLFLEEDWTPRADDVSYGHDIEFSWLITETAHVLGDKNLVALTEKCALEMADVTSREGVDPDGGVLGEANPRGVTDPVKHWWPQAEAVTGFFNAYQISGDAKYLQASAKSWDFIQKNLADHKNGEWFQDVTRDRKPVDSPKVSFWKCPYHNSRACMELLDRIRAMEPAPQ